MCGKRGQMIHTMTITENISQNRKPGRPRKFSADIEAISDAIGLFTDSKTRRNRLNILHRQRALSVMGNNAEGLTWLFDKEGFQRGSVKIKQGILSELGRIDDDESLIAIARQLCELKPTTREAVAMVRRWRLGKDGVGSAPDLAQAMLNAYNDYLMRYPSTGDDERAQALLLLMATLKPSE